MPAAVEALLLQARALEAEIIELANHAVAQSQLAVRAAAFASEVRNETRSIERVASSVPDACAPDENPAANAKPLTAVSTLVSSSNIPFYIAVWDTAKRASRLVAVRHRVSSVGPSKKSKPKGPRSGHKDPAATPTAAAAAASIGKKLLFAPGLRVVPSNGETYKDPQLVVDVVADQGRSWWKVSTVTNKRLLFDLAREGLYLGAGEEGGLEEALEEELQDHEYGDVPLVKMVREYLDAANGHRIRCMPPEMHFVLPRIQENALPEVDLLLAASRKHGARIHTSSTLFPPTPQLSPSLLADMDPGPFSAFSETLNMDTSILVALASDFCHREVEVQPWFARSALAHWEKEKKEKMLDELLPALAGHDMVCTTEVMETFGHIARTIGTDDEQARVRALLEEDDGLSSAERIAILRRLSVHPLSDNLHLPIRPVTLTAQLKARIPHIGQAILASSRDMLHPGLSVFQYGWATGLTTITANMVAARALGKDLELDGRLSGDQWPRLWVASSSRPLLGVPKSRRVRKHVSECESGCVCGIDRFHGGRTYEESDKEASEARNGS